MRHAASAILFLAILAGCGSGCDRDDGAGPTDPAAATTVTPRQAADGRGPATRAAVPRVVFLGDSLTAGLGLPADQAFPAVAGELLRDEGLPVDIVNAGVSGDTTAGGLRRLDWLLRQKPDVLVVGLGGNDGLRGLELRASEQNLRAIVKKANDAGASVLLLGMLIPPNYGPDYAGKFRDLYPRIAQETGVPLVPFLLEGVGGHPELNQPDGIHPTAEGHAILARNVLPRLRDLLRQKAGTTRPPPITTTNR